MSKHNFNYVRTCFYVEKTIDTRLINILLNNIKKYNCKKDGEPRFNQGKFADQDLLWTIQTTDYYARFLQIYLSLDNIFLSFDIDENIFLPGRVIEYTPVNNEETFLNYKDIIKQVIISIHPEFGIIDYEADLAADNKLSSIVPCWGNFLSFNWLNKWDLKDKNILFQTLDEFSEIEEIGILGFVHPLRANQGWGNKHVILQDLYNKYITRFGEV